MFNEHSLGDCQPYWRWRDKIHEAFGTNSTVCDRLDNIVWNQYNKNAVLLRNYENSTTKTKGD